MITHTEDYYMDVVMEGIKAHEQTGWAVRQIVAYVENDTQWFMVVFERDG